MMRIQDTADFKRQETDQFLLGCNDSMGVVYALLRETRAREIALGKACREALGHLTPDGPCDARVWAAEETLKDALK